MLRFLHFLLFIRYIVGLQRAPRRKVRVEVLQHRELNARHREECRVKEALERLFVPPPEERAAEAVGAVAQRCGKASRRRVRVLACIL